RPRGGVAVVDEDAVREELGDVLDLEVIDGVAAGRHHPANHRRGRGLVVDGRHPRTDGKLSHRRPPDTVHEHRMVGGGGQRPARIELDPPPSPPASASATSPPPTWSRPSTGAWPTTRWVASSTACCVPTWSSATSSASHPWTPTAASSSSGSWPPPTSDGAWALAIRWRFNR